MSNEKLIKNFRVDSERDNKLLFRKEIKYTVDFKSGKTVSRNEIKKLLMDYYKAKEDVIVVDRNIQETGKDSLKGYVKIYDTKEHAMLYEPDYELTYLVSLLELKTDNKESSELIKRRITAIEKQAGETTGLIYNL